jgi:hypothetical protein
MDLKEIGREFVDWAHLAQDRVQWQTLVKTLNLLNSWVIICSKEGFCSMELVSWLVNL